jgi:peptide-methionine (R)-S-oxide reductase
MDSSKRLLAAGILVVGIAAVSGIVLSSQATNSTSPPGGSSIAKPPPPKGAQSPVDEKDEEWQSRLTAEQYRVTRQKADEPPFSGKYWNHTADGVYSCVCCATPLFYSSAKFDSGTGWPSFYQPIDDQKIDTMVDFSLFTQRTEVVCRNCKAHLGHVFEDGPKPTGLRYRINSLALGFQESSSQPKTAHQ